MLEHLLFDARHSLVVDIMHIRYLFMVYATAIIRHDWIAEFTAYMYILMCICVCSCLVFARLVVPKGRFLRTKVGITIIAKSIQCN